jgi:F420H(2)-dependent quinone reductase
VPVFGRVSKQLICAHGDAVIATAAYRPLLSWRLDITSPERYQLAPLAGSVQLRIAQRELASASPAGERQARWRVDAARGDDAHYMQNLRANPAVRIKIGRRWLPGTAEVLPHDPGQRLAWILAHFGWLRRANAKALQSSIRLLDSTPRVVRINIIDQPGNNP